MPFESLGAVSYSSSIVTMAVSVAVSEIFRQVRSRSLEMEPFDRSHTGFYSPSMAISCILCKIGYRDLLVENREIFIPHLYLCS